MNKKDWRDRLLTVRAWNADTTKGFSSELDDVLNLALQRIASDVPGAVIPDIDNVVVNKDFTEADFGRGVSSTTDPYVMSFGLGLGLKMTPETDGTWNGNYHIEFEDAKGVHHRRQCREFWLETVKLTHLNQYLVSLDRPLQSAILPITNVKFRLHQPEFFFSDDVMELVDGGIHDPNVSQIICLPQAFASYMEHDNIRGNVIGRPQYCARGRHFQIDAPVKAPTAALGEQGTWAGPEPIGAFEYVFTYCWGKRDAEFSSNNGTALPLWESAPSPVSSVATVGTYPGPSVVLTLPEIDWQLNFGDSASLRYSRSGIYKRIYRRRNVTGASPSHPTIEAGSIFQYLADIDGITTTYTDNGSVVPDYYRRLPESQGYYAYTFYPHQDQRYEVDFRVRRRPEKLVNDYDAPPVHPDCHDGLIELGLYYLCLMDRQQEEANNHLQLYLTIHLPKLKAMYANPARMIPGLPWFVQNYPNRRFAGLRFGPMTS